jgi:hypothetical protein
VSKQRFGRRLLRLLKTPTFRLAAYFALTLSVVILLLFAFIFWQTSVLETARVDHILMRDAELIAEAPPDEIDRAVNQRLTADFHRVIYCSLFDATGRWIAGNLDKFPLDLPLDGKAHRTRVDVAATRQFSFQVGRMVGRHTRDGRVLVIGRNVDSLEDLEEIVLRSLELGLIPAVLLALTGGIVLGRRTQHHIQAIHEATARIAQGELWERLPTRNADDTLDRLATNVNQMLDGLGEVLDQVKSTSDHIAHDLRTPLTRVRTQLDRARDLPHTNDAMRILVDQAIGGLDQALRIITALRRIAQIEARERRAGFAEIDLATILAEVGEFYAPVAEEKSVSLVVEPCPATPAFGDRDLLIEAIANLVDNAIKYTQTGGWVRLSIDSAAGWPLVRVEDDGPGIAAEECEAVMRRFYRSQRTRHIQGCGLGLSIVEAIAKLHGFPLAIRAGNPGCIVELGCHQQHPHA